MFKEEKTAIHEAGHSVLFAKLLVPMGMQMSGASIISDEFSAGRLMHEELQLYVTEDQGMLDWQNKAAEAMALVCAAGYAALKVNGYSEQDAEEGCGGDWQDIEDLMGSLDRLCEFKIKATDMLKEPEYRNALKLISSELLAKKELNGEAMDFLTDVAFGEATFEDYTEWSSRASGSWQ